jgi:hypothetical protein
MDLSGQLHVPVALHKGKETVVPIGKEAGWTPDPVWTVEEREGIILLVQSSGNTKFHIMCEFDSIASGVF